jgi:hypothetical protein
MIKQPKLNRSQWIRFRAEQLAVRSNGLTFLTLYKKRSVTFGFEDYEDANREFRTFLQPYIDDARRAYEAEAYAAIWYQTKAGTWAPPAQGPKVVELAGVKTVVHDVKIDEDEDQEEYVCNCGAEVAKGENICDDCDVEFSNPGYGEKY